MEIKNRFTGEVIYAGEAATLKDLVGIAVTSGANLYGADLYGANLYGADLGGADLYGANLRGADLYGANLYGADLYGADLRGANLRGADLRGANLRGADLRGADLRGADLYGADLRDADLGGAKISWQSHALLAEILNRAAGDDAELRKIAGLIAISTDWCWDKFQSAMSKQDRDWCGQELAKWIQPDDGHPAILDGYTEASA